MRNVILMLLLVFGVGAPAFAQEAGKPEKEAKKKESETDKSETEENGEAEKEDDKDEEEDKDKNKMTAAGETLYKDVVIIYDKYYATLLEKFKDNEPYKSADVWNEAVKEAKNAKFKDREEFEKSVLAMQRKDRAFKKKLQALMVKKAKEYAAAIKKAPKEK